MSLSNRQREQKGNKSRARALWLQGLLQAWNSAGEQYRLAVQRGGQIERAKASQRSVSLAESTGRVLVVPLRAQAQEPSLAASASSEAVSPILKQLANQMRRPGLGFE